MMPARQQLMALITFGVLASPVCGAAGLSSNIYWPGSFEHGLFGGAYSNNQKVHLSRTANHTPGGEYAWEIRPGYQHLELLVPGNSAYRLSFWMLTHQNMTLHFKVIGAPDATQGGAATFREHLHPIAVTGSTAWQSCQLEFTTAAPYPGPVLTEVLLTAFNGGTTSAFIDDLSIQRRVCADKTQARVFTSTTAISNGTFERGATNWFVPYEPPGTPLAAGALQSRPELPRHGTLLVLDTTATPAVAQIIRSSDLAGTRIRLSADVAFLTNKHVAHAWSGVLFVLSDGATVDSPLLTPEPAPFWYVVALSEPPGVVRRISAEYDIPVTSTALCLRIVLQPQVGRNLAIVDNVLIEVQSNCETGQPSSKE